MYRQIGLKAKPKEDDLARYAPIIRATEILYYISVDDDIQFDQAVNTLTPAHLYQNFLIVPIYWRYEARKMYDVARAYLIAAITYLQENGETVAKDVIALREAPVSEALKEKIRNALVVLRSLGAGDVPGVMPSILNGKTKLNEFILCEIVTALAVVRQKLKAIESIAKEDKYNDLLVAMLRLKLPFFGWEIAEQVRTGPSQSGKDSGEADHVIRAAGKDLALVEALNLRTGDFGYVELHLLKAQEYIRELYQHYIIVYYIGERKNYDALVNTYKQDVAKVDFEPDAALDTTRGFENLNKQFDNSKGFDICRTYHGPNGYEMYHIIIDLSQLPKASADAAPKTHKKKRTTKNAATRKKTATDDNDDTKTT